MQRRRVKQTLSFKERLAQEADEARQQAELFPPGAVRDALLRKARQADTASQMDQWLSSPGLQSPK